MSNTHKTINPATEEVLEIYPLMSRQEAESIIQQSHHAFLSWRKPDLLNALNYCVRLPR